VSLAALELRIANPAAEPGRMVVSGIQTREDGTRPDIEVVIPAKSDGWVRLDGLSSVTVSKLRIEAVPGTPDLTLGGVRVEKNTALNWPWGTDINLIPASTHASREAEQVGFEMSGITTGSCRVREILNDNGETVLGRLTCPPDSR